MLGVPVRIGVDPGDKPQSPGQRPVMVLTSPGAQNMALSSIVLSPYAYFYTSVTQFPSILVISLLDRSMLCWTSAILTAILARSPPASSAMPLIAIMAVLSEVAILEVVER